MAIKDSRQSKISEKINIKTIKDYVYALEKAFKNNGMLVVVAEIEFLNDGIRYSLEVEEGIKVDKILSLEKEIAFCLASSTGKISIETPTSNMRFFNITVPYRKEELPKAFSGKRSIFADILFKLSNKIYELGVKVHRKA